MKREEFIRAMRGVAHSVTVVTTDGPGGRHGATVSAFCSVSADPPMALVCLNKASSITASVLENKVFAINILPEDAVHIANRFAGMHDAEINDRFEGIVLGASQLPSIKGSTVFSCDIDETVLSGSHMVIIGKVLSVEDGDHKPLTYMSGAYHHTVPLPKD